MYDHENMNLDAPTNERLRLTRGKTSVILLPPRFPDHFKKLSVAPKPEFSTSRFVERIQIHGLADFYHASSCIARFFWLSLILLCFTIATLSISKNVLEFLTSPVQTSVTKVPQSRMALPPSYICPYNYIDYEKVHRLGLEQALGNFQQLIIDGARNNVFSAARAVWNPENATIKPNLTMVSSQKDMKQTVLQAGFDPAEIFKICDLDGSLINCTEYIEPVVDQFRGLCFLIHSQKLPEQEYAGAGLHLFIDLHADIQNPIGGNDLSYFTGLSVKFGENAHPYALGGHLAGPGQYVRYQLYKQISHLRGSTSRCLERDQEPTLVYLNTTYSKLACDLDCALQIVVPKCHCMNLIDTSLLMEKYWDAPVCGKERNAECFRLDKANQKLLGDCVSKKCIAKCEAKEYTIHESSMELGSLQMRLRAADVKAGRNLSKLADPEYWKTSMVILHVTFAELYYLSIVQLESVTIAQLVADIGGQIGLWLGASIFSICQLSTLFLSWCYTKLHRFTAPKKERKLPGKSGRKKNVDVFE